jgi:hypothetical protein
MPEVAPKKADFPSMGFAGTSRKRPRGFGVPIAAVPG